MSTLRHVSMSVIEYRPSLFERAAPIPLGVVLSASIGRLHLLALTAKESLADEEVQRLDPLARELLAKPFSLLSEQLRKATAGAKSPDQALGNFSAGNQWSVYVSPPRPRELKASVFEITKMLTLRRVLRDAYRLHQSGLDPFATTAHKAAAAKGHSAGEMQIERLDPRRQVWESRRQPLRLAFTA